MDSKGFLEDMDPIAPVMSIQGARALKSLTGRGPAWRRTAVVLRGCEMRAATELAKLRQLRLDNVITIGVDCPGAFPPDAYAEGDREEMNRRHEAALGKGGLEGARSVCRVCHRPTGDGADIEIGFIGGADDGFWVIGGTEAGAVIVEGIEGDAVEDLSFREKAVEKFRSDRKAVREETLNGFQKTVQGTNSLLETLSACINCHNCSRVCPICFCRECYFDSAALRTEADSQLNRARRKGGLRLPSDMLLFHLGRMNHMSVSCVSCGACEDACPADIPVSMLFSLAARDTQALFDYEPGRRPDEPLPFSVYENEELQEWEQPYTRRHVM
jgi:formate dehydrogenase subunit beta